MANVLSIPLNVTITGDGIATTAVVTLASAPSAVTFTGAYDLAGNNVTANVISAILVGSVVTITFLAPFSTTVQILLNLAYTTYSNPVSQSVTGTFWQATQPVSLATAPTTPVTGTFFQTTQPVSIATMPTTPVNFTQLNSVALGSPSNYGTSPGAVASQAIDKTATDAAILASVSGVWNAIAGVI